MSSRWDRCLHLSSFYATASLCAHKHTCTPHTYAHNHPFTLPLPVPRGTRRKERSERGADNSKLRTRQSHLLAEVLDLINGSRLHCALNHAQIKKLVIFKINGGRGQLFDSLLKPMEADESPPPPPPRSCRRRTAYELSPSVVRYPPCRPLHPHRCLREAAPACQSGALTVLPPSFIQHFIIICCYCSISS